MIKNIISFLFFLFILLFFYFVIYQYLSENNKKQINLNRLNINDSLMKKTSELSYLKNDTDDIVEYNFETNTKTKRSFWDLRKK